MKIYDFKCVACSRREERAVKRHDDPVKCKCGEPMVKLPPATRTFWKFADKRA